MKKISSMLILALLALCASQAWAGTSTTPAPAKAGVAVLAEGDDEEEEEPYVEPPFSVTFNVDNDAAVYFKVFNFYGAENEEVSPITPTNGTCTVTVDPGDGYIMAYVNDGFAFTKFLDATNNSDYLWYSNQVQPVTVRKVISTNISGEGDDQQAEVITVDGHVFTIETLDQSTLATYTLTVTVDDASKTVARIGSSSDMNSQANRTVSMQDGTNTVTYTSADKYIHFSGINWTAPLYNVTFNDRDVVDDGSISKVFTIPLKGNKTDGGVVVVTANAPVVEDSYSFTLTINDTEAVRFISKMPADTNCDFSEGENTLTFSDGDYFQIWSNVQASECSVDGVAIEPVLMYGVYVYTLNPVDGSSAVLTYAPRVPQFSIFVDDITKVSKFQNQTKLKTITLTQGDNNVEIAVVGNKFRLSTVNKVQAYSFKMDGNDVTFNSNSGYYEFIPADGSEVIVYFNEPAPSYPVMTVTVDIPANVVVSTSTTYTLQEGDNELTISDGFTHLKIEPSNAEGATILGVYYTEAGSTIRNEVGAQDGGYYSIAVVNGRHIEIETTNVEFDEAFAFIIDNVEVVEGYNMLTAADREIELYDWFNEIPFNSDFDQIVMFVFEPMPEAVFVNGELLELDPEFGCYWFFPTHGDIVRVYFDPLETSHHDITFDVQDEVADKFTIYRDLYQDVDHISGSSRELHGTWYVLIPVDETPLTVTLYSNSGVVSAPSFAEANPSGIEIPMEDGAYMFQLTEDTRVSVKKTSTGITDIEADSADSQIFNLQGIRVTNPIPGNIYIKAGQKVLVK